jgi:hypothetical protein
MTDRRSKAPPQMAPPKWEEADVGAIQALMRGDAQAHQQQRAMKWIVEAAAMTYDQPFSEVSERLTDFACGRMFVGQQIVKMTKLDLKNLKELRKPHA